jgi:hypothetical protein
MDHIAVNYPPNDPKTGLVAVICTKFEKIVEEREKELMQQATNAKFKSCENLIEDNFSAA